MYLRYTSGNRPPADDAILSRHSEGDAWLVGVGKRASHGLRCLYYFYADSLVRLKAYYIIALNRTQKVGGTGQGR